MRISTCPSLPELLELDRSGERVQGGTHLASPGAPDLAATSISVPPLKSRPVEAVREVQDDRKIDSFGKLTRRSA